MATYRINYLNRVQHIQETSCLFFPLQLNQIAVGSRSFFGCKLIKCHSQQASHQLVVLLVVSRVYLINEANKVLNTKMKNQVKKRIINVLNYNKKSQILHINHKIVCFLNKFQDDKSIYINGSFLIRQAKLTKRTLVPLISYSHFVTHNVFLLRISARFFT